MTVSRATFCGALLAKLNCSDTKMLLHEDHRRSYVVHEGSVLQEIHSRVHADDACLLPNGSHQGPGCACSAPAVHKCRPEGPQ